MATPPVAGGFAAALETYLSRGGSRQTNPKSKTRGGLTYGKGPIRGKTVEEATVQARQMWMQAPSAVREKYAAMAGEGLLAPSEASAEKARVAAEIKRTGGRSFSDGTRRPSPGDSNGDGVLDDRQAAPAAAAPVNPAATAGAGRGTAIKGAATPAETAQAQKVAAEAPTEFAPTSAVATRSAAASTDRPFSGGLMAPSRSTVLARPTGEINKLTGKPFGYRPPAAPTIPGVERPVATSQPIGMGVVPRAQEVKEAPMSQQDYEQARVDIQTKLEPNSPEMSSALGRRRTYEDQQAAASASVARLERVGPSAAQRDEQQRKARRKLDQRVLRSYGATSGYNPLATAER